MSRGAVSRLLSPRSVALVGASERSLWARTAFANFSALRFGGRVVPVNPKGGHFCGLPAANRCSEIGEPIDAALLLVPNAAIGGALAELATAGIGQAVVLSSGYAEVGDEGRRRQSVLAEAARAAGVTLLGPNCLGFVNYVDRVPIWTSGLPTRRRGAVAIVSQSGATARYVAFHAHQQGLGLSYLVSTGNEAHLSTTDIVDHLVDDAATRVILVFLETVRDAERLAAAAVRAHRQGKPIIVLKVGTSELAAHAAQAHTGSLVGDDAVFTAACERYGMIRVRSIEAMIATAALLAETRPWRSGGLAALAISGGVCEIAADRADAAGVPIAPLDAASRAALEAALPDIATPANPLDVTGAAMLEPALFERCTAALGSAEELGLLACLFELSSGKPSRFETAIIRHVGDGARAAGVPAVMLSVSSRPAPSRVRALARRHGLAYLGSGIDAGIAAIGHAMRWAAASPGREERPQVSAVRARPVGEAAALAYLDSRGIEVVPSRRVNSEAAARSAFRDLGGDCAAKIDSPDIAHKSDIGGVRLDIRSDGEAAAAYRAVLAAAARHCPDARLDGVLFAPMRREGVELIVGVTRDPVWGPVIAVGLGGVLVELMRDTQLALLPITVEDALGLLDRLRGARLLDGFRGSAPIDRRRLAAAIVRIGDAALALGPTLDAFEVNPLLAGPDRIEALDALALWSGGDAG